MDVMLHKRCAKFVYVIPDGLRELMSDISREVIRTQPENIYTFIADYLDALMITRENARVAARLVDTIIRIGTTTVELLEKTGLTREEADRMAGIIQNAFKQYMASKKESRPIVFGSETDLEEEQEIATNILDEYGTYLENEEEAAAIIQRAFRAFRERHRREHELLAGMIDWRVAARSAIYLYRKTGVTYEEANRAATLIKAAYKGYYTRRVMRRLLEEGSMLYEDDEDRLQDEEDLELEEMSYGGGKPTPHWSYYSQMMSTDDAQQGSPTTELDATSTEVADSIMDSVLKFIPSESEPGQASAGDWTEVAADKPVMVEGLEAGLDTETAEYLDTLQDIAEEDLTVESGTFTTERSNPEFTALLEGEAALSPEHVEDEEGQEYLGSPEEAAEGVVEAVVEAAAAEGAEEQPGTSTVEETEYTETVTDTEQVSDVEPMEEA